MSFNINPAEGQVTVGGATGAIVPGNMSEVSGLIATAMALVRAKPPGTA